MNTLDIIHKHLKERYKHQDLHIEYYSKKNISQITHHITITSKSETIYIYSFENTHILSCYQLNSSEESPIDIDITNPESLKELDKIIPKQTTHNPQSQNITTNNQTLKIISKHLQEQYPQLTINENKSIDTGVKEPIIIYNPTTGNITYIRNHPNQLYISAYDNPTRTTLNINEPNSIDKLNNIIQESMQKT